MTNWLLVNDEELIDAAVRQVAEGLADVAGAGAVRSAGEG